MPVTRELKIVYGTITVGAGTARQITEYYRHEEEFERGYFEFEFITTAATASAWETEINVLRDEFRKPRLDLVVTLGSTDFLTRKHSDNTALDTAPRILKDGDPADTGRSRHFRVRIDYGLPADNVSADFRRYADTIVNFLPSRQKIITYRGVYTAESGGDTTAALAQYREKINAAFLAVQTTVDAAATFETIGEPEVTFNETNKVCEFEIVAKQVLENQRSGTLDDADIVDPILTIDRERWEPGDSTAGSIGVVGVGAARHNFGPLGNTSGGRGTATAGTTPTPGGTTITQRRPIKITIHYECNINVENTKDLDSKYLNTIRPFIIGFAKSTSKMGPGVSGALILRDSFQPDYYNNRIVADLEMIAYSGDDVFQNRITFNVSTEYGRRLVPVLDGKPFSFYDYPGPATRVARSTQRYSQPVGSADPQKIVIGLITAANPGAKPNVFGDTKNWVLISYRPLAAILKQGIDSTKLIAEVEIEVVAQFRIRKPASGRSFGGITGITIT